MSSNYTEEFRQEAIQMAINSNDTQKEVAERLGVNPVNLKNWIYNYRRKKKLENPCEFKITNKNQDPSNPESISLQDYAKLQRENARLIQERDILKKAMAYFVEVPK